VHDLGRDRGLAHPMRAAVGLAAGSRQHKKNELMKMLPLFGLR